MQKCENSKEYVFKYHKLGSLISKLGKLPKTTFQHAPIMIPGFRDALAAAAAKSLQSCPTLCDPIAGSPPGSSVWTYTNNKDSYSISHVIYWWWGRGEILAHPHIKWCDPCLSIEWLTE